MTNRDKRIVNEQFYNYWVKENKHWRTKVKRKKGKYKILMKVAKRYNSLSYEIVREILGLGHYVSSVKLRHLFVWTPKEYNCILEFIGYERNADGFSYFCNHNRYEQMQKICDSIEAYIKICNENNNKFDYSYKQKVLGYLSRGFRRFGQYFINHGEEIEVKINASASSVDPANGEREHKIQNITYAIIVVLMIICALGGTIFVGKSINEAMPNPDTLLDWSVSSGFWGAILGSLVAGCATICTTYLIIHRDYKIDYHRERMAVLPVLSIRTVLNESVYIDNRGDWINQGIAEADYYNIYTYDDNINGKLFEIKNNGTGIAFNVRRENSEGGDFFGDFMQNEKKYIRLYVRDERRIVLVFNDMYENIYTQALTIKKHFNQYIVMVSVPELVMRTNRARYQQ
jgi:hypothetical protein